MADDNIAWGTLDRDTIAWGTTVHAAVVFQSSDRSRKPSVCSPQPGDPERRLT
jgi:hypothetical protein